MKNLLPGECKSGVQSVYKVPVFTISKPTFRGLSAGGGGGGGVIGCL